jgi:hypothetical protein
MVSYTYFLFFGILFIVAALIIRNQNLPILYFFITLTTGVVLKAFFLLKAFRLGIIKKSIPLYILLTGVLFIFVSMVLKHGFGIGPFAVFILYFGLSLKFFSVAYLLVLKYVK